MVAGVEFSHDSQIYWYRLWCVNTEELAIPTEDICCLLVVQVLQGLVQ